MRVAIKKIDFKMLEKDSYLEQSIYSEIKILSKFKHSNIVELYEVLNSKRSLYIIMEFCQDGDLKKSLQKRGRYSE
jgi:serine/threonine-protein kinase ULK/ATG1